jgi:hypothetical protein
VKDLISPESCSPESQDFVNNNENDDSNSSNHRHCLTGVDNKNRKTSDQDLMKILDSLQKHEKVSISNKWKEKSLSSLKVIYHQCIN